MDQRNFLYMFYGFAAAWAILAVYAVTLARRGKRIQSQIESLKHMIEDREKK